MALCSAAGSSRAGPARVAYNISFAEEENMQIEGASLARRAEVNSLQQLLTHAMIVSRTAWTTLYEGLVWTIPFDAIDPTGADDYFLYILNNGPDPLAVSKLHVTSTVAGTLELQTVTGTAVGGTAITVVNRHRGITKTPDATIQSGVDITGLTDAGVLEFVELGANAQASLVLRDEPIILEQSQAVAFLWTEATGVLTGNVTLELMKTLV
jgi:hypothetical protein